MRDHSVDRTSKEPASLPRDYAGFLISGFGESADVVEREEERIFQKSGDSREIARNFAMGTERSVPFPGNVLNRLGAKKTKMKCSMQAVPLVHTSERRQTRPGGAC